MMFLIEGLLLALGAKYEDYLIYGGDQRVSIMLINTTKSIETRKSPENDEIIKNNFFPNYPMDYKPSRYAIY